MTAPRGPIPKRSDQRVRRNADEVPVTTLPVDGEVPVPELGLKNPHPLVVDMYESLKDSGQAKFYEPSDWQYARLTMHLLNDMIRPRRSKKGTGSYDRISAMSITAINQMLTALLVTEGDRRRVRLEIQRRQGGEDEGKVLDVADRFRQMLTQPQPGSPGAG